MARGDFDGNGKLDLALVVGNLVTILLGNGDGTFETKAAYNAGNLPDAIAVADFDGDGQMDLAVVNESDNNVSILLGNGDGTFRSATNFPGTAAAGAIAVADFNGDGSADLAIANRNNSLTILLGNGDGTFQAANQIPLDGTPNSLAVGDFDSDGRADIAIITGVSLSVSVLLGNGDGTFQVSPSPFYLSASRTVQTADFNGDGKPDLVITSKALAFFVMLGNGDGTFQAPVSYQTRTSDYALSIEDFNGDGRPDVAITNYMDGEGDEFSFLAFFFGNGDGTFQSPNTPWGYNFGSGGLPYDIAVVGDFNGDGKADFVLASQENDVAVNVMVTGGQSDLTVTASQRGAFTQDGAAYNITVNNVGAVASSGALQLTATLPPALTASGMTGTAWNCSVPTLTCTSTNPVGAGQSSLPIVLTLNVAPEFTGSVTSTFTVSGGGESNTANDSAQNTAVVSLTCAITGDTTASVADVQQIVNEALGLSRPQDDMNQDTRVNVRDVQIIINAALGRGCSG